jgi:D-glycero-D-manno-heptose 1,7-bisphosphate phosphatase
MDRDGVLVEDRDYAFRPSDVHLLPGVAESLKLASQQGYALIVITNQSGVARGKFALADVFTFHDELNRQIVAQGAPPIEAFYICPHLPEGSVPVYSRVCHCRKPAPGLVLQAASDLDLDLARSWFVGDKAADIACAEAAGVRGAQVMTKHGERAHPAARAEVRSLFEFVSSSEFT